MVPMVGDGGEWPQESLSLGVTDHDRYYKDLMSASVSGGEIQLITSQRA